MSVAQGPTSGSEALYARARRLLPGGVSTNVRLTEKPRPQFLQSAKGSHLIDVDGRELIDYVCGFGPIVLGHTPSAVVEAVSEALAIGQAFGGSHALEVELAEAMNAAVPSLEMVRFSSSGSEAVHAALRLARAFTGRPKIVRFEGHYHGWFDSQVIGYRPPLDRPPSATGAAVVTESRGIPAAAAADLIVLPWNDVAPLAAAFEQHQGEIAAVIMEPIMANSGCIEPANGYLQAVRELCDQHGALLIFDEIITGFRVGLDGAQGLYDLRPDLSVFGKAMAAGFPISALGGRRDVMRLVVDGGTLHAGTYNGNVACVAAGCATLRVLAADPDSLYGGLRRTGQRLMAGLTQLAAEAGVSLLTQGPGPVFWLWFTDQEHIDDFRTSMQADYTRYDAFSAAMLRQGVRIMPGGRWYVSAAHTDDDIEQTLAAARTAFAELAVGRRGRPS
ncbi:MAG TPA: glutamate-1-semialdehyde 2,1-aminomutase [Limnochordia bacterium]|nr:glutamate-1-semialdehyde 2,1-aminomutase [Limnochordia bacterium]